MSQIFRIVKPEIIQICRFYGSSRNLHNHYETLRLTASATQKDIRQAFVKLSKEMHPDTSKKSNHAEFVKVNEAYKVLSKEHTRKQYDMEMRNRMPGGHPIREVYYEPDERGWHFRQTVYHRDRNGPNFHTTEGEKRFSKDSIVLLIIGIMVFGTFLQLSAVSRSITIRHNLTAESSKYALEYKKVRLEAEGKDFEQRIADFEGKLAAGDDDPGIDLQS